MANTFTLIGSSTVDTSGVSYIEFTSIPQTYKDLTIVLSARLTNNGDSFGNILISFNGAPSGSDYSVIFLIGGGSSPTSAGGAQTPDSIRANYAINGSASTSDVFSNTTIYIPNYTDTTGSKNLILDSVGENISETEARKNLTAGRWNPATSAAITSVRLTANYSSSETYALNTTAYLYGIKNS